MWFLMFASLLWAWLEPMECLLRHQSFEMSCPLILVVLGFWGLYALLDLCLNAPALWRSFWEGFARSRRAREERARWKYWISGLWSDFGNQTFVPVIENREQALLWAWTHAGSQDAVQGIREALGRLAPKEADEILLAVYTARHPERALLFAFDLLFLHQRPPWFERWEKGRLFSLSQMARLPVPNRTPDASWIDWWERVLVARLLQGNTSWDELPPSILDRYALRWAGLELGVQAPVSGDALSGLYEELRSGQVINIHDWQRRLQQYTRQKVPLSEPGCMLRQGLLQSVGLIADMREI